MTVVGLLQRRVARETGTAVEVWHGLDFRPGWQILCVEHGDVCTQTSRRAAVGLAAHPIEWCPGCQGDG